MEFEKCRHVFYLQEIMWILKSANMFLIYKKSCVDQQLENLTPGYELEQLEGSAAHGFKLNQANLVSSSSIHVSMLVLIRNASLPISFLIKLKPRFVNVCQCHSWFCWTQGLSMSTNVIRGSTESKVCQCLSMSLLIRILKPRFVNVYQFQS